MYVIAKKPKVNTIFLNLPRSLNGTVNYQAIEQAKDGDFTSTKYFGKEITITTTNIIIFTNKALDWNAFSQDRWKIMVLNGDKFEWFTLTSFLAA